MKPNIAVRWDAQFITGSDGQKAQTITDMYQPRIGFTFQPGEIGSQKIFGSYGRFYETLPLFFSGLYISGFEFIAFFTEDPRNISAVGDTTAASGARPIPQEVKGLEGQYFDEFTLGYERQLAQQFKIGIRGIYRNLGQAVDDGYDPAAGFVLGNPGKGSLSFLPELNRKYAALEFTLEKSRSRRFNFMASYVLSRNQGNYGGLFNSVNNLGPIPNTSRSLDIPEQVPNSSGLLPNDRTHSFKFYGSYLLDFGLSVGTSIVWQSGTPISELGGTSFGIPLYSYLTKRGSFGRTPSIRDFNLRISYAFHKMRGTLFRPKLILDILHLGSERATTNVDQIHFAAIDANGKQTGENPNFGVASAFQPPMTIRLGLEIGF